MLSIRHLVKEERSLGVKLTPEGGREMREREGERLDNVHQGVQIKAANRGNQEGD